MDAARLPNSMLPAAGRSRKPADRALQALAAAGLCLGLCLPLTPAGASPLLQRLASVPAPSGYEDSLRTLLVSELPGWCRPEADALGNLVVDLGGEGPVRLVAACMDEPAYIVSDVDSLGYLRLARLSGSGRLWDQFHVGQRFLLLGSRGAIPAVSATPSIHLTRRAPAALEPAGSADLWLDAGFRSATEAGRAGISVLDPVTLLERISSLAGSRAAGVGLEGRGETLALLKALSGPRIQSKAHWVVAFTAQGQPGGRGLKRLLRRYEPSQVVLLGGFPRGVLGKGPVVWADSLKALAPELASALVRLGGKDAQRGAMAYAPDLPGLDALGRTPAAVVGLPVRYPRTPVEIIDEADVAALSAFLRRMLEAP